MKRANGQGSLAYNKERKRWEMRVTIDGQRRKVVGKTQAEATERAATLRRNAELGPGLSAEVTVAQFLDHWSTEVLPMTAVSQVTIDGYRRIVRLYITPIIGKVRLDRLTPAHVRKLLSALKNQGLSPNTIRQARSVLRRALGTAEADELVTRNVAAIVDGIKMDAPKGRTLTPEQARAVLDTAARHEYGALLTVLLSTGLRKGEALGLSWSSLDLEPTPATLTVSRSLKIAADYTTYLDQPKTAGSRRRVHLPAPVADVLRHHRVKQNAERLAFGTDWGGQWADRRSGVHIADRHSPRSAPCWSRSEVDHHRGRRRTMDPTRNAPLGRITHARPGCPTQDRVRNARTLLYPCYRRRLRTPP
jgi:integrase